MSGMNSSTGRALAGLDHLRQSIRDILTTPVGSRICRRRYGSDIPELIDQPLNAATILRIYAATAYALALWEPRVTLTAVNLSRDTDGALCVLLQGVANGQAVDLSVPVRQGETA
jgi:phage baseplate assembly protein W